ncbi:VOC family protein [Patescibacteria group bacterium]|nr:VOC family protein [Patescibacteria group bacterium]
MLKNTNLSVCIWSDNYKALAGWYRDTLDLPVREELTLPSDTGIDFDFGGNYFSVGRHDKVHGKNKDPYRIMIGFEVESVAKTYAELQKKGVTVIAAPFEGPPGGFWCMTIADPEGNILQFFGDK